MKNLPYQSIFNTLKEVMPKNWHRIIFYAEYDDNSYSMKYFVDLGDGQYTDCFKLNNISKNEIINTFAVIDSQIMPIRKELDKKDTWSVMTLIVDESGKFKAEYEYDDISNNSIEYYRKWKDKYLI